MTQETHQINMICKNCSHWKNQQAELDYSKNHGICTCYKWKFGIVNNGSVMVLDRQNRSSQYMGVHRFESQNNQIPIGDPEKSRYAFVTEEEFVCDYFNYVP